MTMQRAAGCGPAITSAPARRVRSIGRRSLGRTASVVLAASVLLAAAARAQEAPRFTLAEAQSRARAASPELAAAREAIAAATGMELQARALPNPTFNYGREETKDSGRTNSQTIAMFEQPLELTGRRGLRREAARERREAAERRLAWAERELDFEVTRAYAAAAAADAKTELASSASRIFARARTASTRRRGEGDVSGYEDRRVGLENARYAGLEAEAESTREVARASLASLLHPSGERHALPEAPFDDAIFRPSAQTADLARLKALAIERRPDLAAAILEQQALETDARLRAREALPTPVAGFGYKSERSSGQDGRFDGWVVQLSVPIPLWDRNRGATEAARADARRAQFALQTLRRQIALDVEGAWQALCASEKRLDILRPQLENGGEVVLRASRVAYDEGEISLVEWLDSVRVHYEVRAQLVNLISETTVRRAALERAIGGPLP
jgi:cobalt-zinc-cadmium efflux system outer membrane protein